MSKIPAVSLCLGFLFALILNGTPTLAHPSRNFIVNELHADCATTGDVGSASFVTDPREHRLVLQLTGSGSAISRGVANFVNTTFESIAVIFKGECVEDLLPATFVVRVKFLPPGTSTPLDHGYDCARNIERVFPNGLIQMRITKQSVCDCDDKIPPGSKLLSVSLDLICADKDDSVIHREYVHRLIVNGHIIPFDPHTRSAFCSSVDQ